MNCSTEIVNNIRDKMNNSMEKLLIDIDLENLIKYKVEYEKQKEEISCLKREKQDLIEEMEHFKKVSILKSMVSQISEKDTEIKILKSIIRNKDKIIKSLQNEKKSYTTVSNKSVLLDENEQLPPGDKDPKEITQESEPTPVREEETPDEEPKETTQESEPTPVREEETPDEEPKETTQESVPTPVREEETPDEEPKETTQESEPTPVREEETPDEEPKETTQESVPSPSSKEENLSKEKTVKKLKGSEYYIIENKIFEKKKNTVGKQVGICIIEQKKKKYKFTNKK